MTKAKKEVSSQKAKDANAATLSKSDLELVDESHGIAPVTAPRLVNKDNGTQTFSESTTEKVNEPTPIVTGAAKMDNTGTDDVKVDYIETPVVVREKRVIDESLSAEDYDKQLEYYKTNLPHKYESAKLEFEKIKKDLAAKKTAK